MRYKKPKKIYREITRNNSCVAIEIKPCVRSVKFHGIKNWKRVAFPYIIFIIGYIHNDHGYFYKSTNVFFFKKTYRKNMKAKFLEAKFLSHTHWSTGAICIGDGIYNTHANSLEDIIDFVLHKFWYTPFAPTGLGVKKWISETKKNPKFVLDLNYPEALCNLPQAIKGYFC